MKKKLFLRCLVGAPIGLAINTVIAIVISCIAGQGEYLPVASALIDDFGSEMRAVMVQAVCTLLYGALWGGLSMVWKMEHWSLLRQTVTHLLLCSGATLPVAWLLRWMEHSAAGIIGYFALFFAIYLFIWLTQYAVIRCRIRKINSKVRAKN